jgi:hypothetical protein
MWRGRIDPCVGTGMRRFHPNWDGKHLSLTSSWTRKRQAATPPMRQCPAAVPGDPGMQLSEDRSLSARPASASLLLFLLITHANALQEPKTHGTCYQRSGLRNRSLLVLVASITYLAGGFAAKKLLRLVSFLHSISVSIL